MNGTGECANHYSAILRRNPSTSSRMFKEKNLGNSVEEGVRDNGGMCCKAFLDGERTQDGIREPWNTQVLTTGVDSPGVSLRALEHSLSQGRVSVHGGSDQGGEERQVPNGRGV